MKRREFITLAGGMAVWPLAARAQQPQRMKRVAMIHPATKPADMRIGGDPNYTMIFEEIKRLGYVEGINLIVDRYSAEGRYDRFAEIAKQVVAAQPDVIFAVANGPVLALHAETRTIPIVAWTGDPIALGIVQSLARPGGNITGLSTDAGAELYGKEVELLVQAVGTLSNARLLTALAGTTVRAAFERMNISYRLERLQSPINEAEYRRAFDAMQRDQVDGVVIGGDVENYTNRWTLGRLAQEYRLPAIGIYRDLVEAGALMCYAIPLKAEDRRVAAQIVEILNGGNPAEMPFFQETHWDLIINLKAAKELGLEIPAGLVARADEVIE
jgi:putative ABC transport system substrate-binding protein